MKNLLIISIILIIQILIGIFIFNQIKIDDENENGNLIKNIVELIFIVGVCFYSINIYNKIPSNLINYYYIFTFIIIVIILLIKNKIKFNLYSDNNYIDNNIDPKNIQLNNSYKLFSKYIKRANNNNNYSFEKLYNNNNSKLRTLQVNKNSNNIGEKDYSAYNGYNSDHICHGCECLQRENGYIFCGKFIPGMGAVGCSKKWKCRNCKKCDGNESLFSKPIIDCNNCECHKTNMGKVCGVKDNITNKITKCDNQCISCNTCQGKVESEKNNITIEPSSNLNNVIINNISKIDVDNLF